MVLNKPLKLIISILICQAAGILGSLFTAPNIQTWYASINKSALSPPNWIFAPVWTILFLLMGISLYFVWIKSKKIRGKRQKSQVQAFNKLKKSALIIFSVQIILNILWSAIFFGLHIIGIAYIELMLLWVFILITIIKFYKISKPAAYLLIPYILWVTFAAILNFSLVLANA